MRLSWALACGAWLVFNSTALAQQHPSYEQQPLAAESDKGYHEVPLQRTKYGYYTAAISLISSDGLYHLYNVIVDTAWSGLEIRNRTAITSEKCEDLDIADFTIQKQCYTIFSDAQWSPYADGLLGTGFAKHGLFSNATPPFQNMIQQDLLKSPVFAFSAGSMPSLTFGGYDKSRYREALAILPLIDNEDGLWAVQIDAITFGSEDNRVQLDNTSAIFDTGTVFITLPTTLAELFNRQIGAKRDAMGQYVIDCDRGRQQPNLTFTLAGHDFEVTANDYIIEHDGYCESAVFGLDLNHPAVLLGTAFLQRWYAVFDLGQRRIGLAEAV